MKVNILLILFLVSSYSPLFKSIEGELIHGTPTEIISLPHLQEIWLASSTTRILAFWTYLSIPSTADVRLLLDPTQHSPLPTHIDDMLILQPMYDRERYELMHLIGPHFGPAFLASASRRICGVSIFDFPDEESLRFCLFCKEPGLENAGQDAQWTGPFAKDHGFRLDVQFYRWEMSALNFVEMLEHIFDSFDFNQIDTLELMSHYKGNSAVWQRTLARVQSPSIVSVDGMLNGELLEALGPRLNNTDTVVRAEETLQPLFPRMRQLYLSAPMEREWLASIQAQGEVIDMLKHRKAAGCPVEHLILDEHALSRSSMNSSWLLTCLRGIVNTVELKSKPLSPRPTYSDTSTLLIPLQPFL
jgi:hypothetical protein